MAINLYFVRHGQTFLNKYHRIQGLSNAPLTEKGINDGIAAGKRLSQIEFNAAYSSDMQRAIDTAKYILKENSSAIKTPTISTAFREENFGYFEGSDDQSVWHMIGSPKGANTFNEMIDKFSMEKVVDMIAAADPYGDAETNQDIYDRFMPGLKDVISKANDNDNVLIVAHGTLIRWLVSQFDKSINVADSPKNGGVTKLVANGDNDIKVEFFNKVD
ncbi:histidine phosphatase family protein [Apilactobacillus sp. TMW 2.2459]|uniref:histidine phosphatase family protein n=1 Tax=Apilactobacillus xinyiensis TaxID=2841032 RepID=UPI00200EF304|nr:histidine phosphatase family protein [Apilactobacillus xinyiensis]MCL0311981.1 histidine phosphatase family protein [Apilactobacillus xinyiensis]MCL0318745.1 histidine phosphatase family protein [Apilactobacillus xinyiensis]MCL0329621.1 histidine phosphatase family protein [Apilactobacillus xinyiensis]